MSEKSELLALKMEIVDQLSREELVKIVLTQQKLIEKLQQELEKLKDKQPTIAKHHRNPHQAISYRNQRQSLSSAQKNQKQNPSLNQEDSLDISAKPEKGLGE
jgi:aspartyl/asparaginyl-tRNA synthetase